MGYDDVSERIIDAIGACEASGCMYIVTFLRIFVTIGELERGADSVKLPGRTSVSLAPRFFAKSFFFLSTLQILAGARDAFLPY